MLSRAKKFTLMSLFISVVNHNHDHFIINNKTLANLSKLHNVIVKSNSLPSIELVEYCKKSKIKLIKSTRKKGFGANNNDIFKYAYSKLKMKKEDYFLVLNPDVVVEQKEIKNLLNLIYTYNADIAAINLYKNYEKTIFDNSIRYKHSIFSPFKSIVGIKRNDIYDKSTVLKPINIDWAAGSFLLFKVKAYQELNGFDEHYFMYFEDADICTRAKKLGLKLIYFPQISAVHLAAHNNRKISSKHFLWYLRSMMRYHLLHT